MTELSDNLSDALRRGVAIRNAYFIDEEDPTSQLRPGASESDIESLEEQIGTRLSPTYREFFRKSDGWDHVTATISLMTCQQVAAAQKDDKFRDWFKLYWDEDLGPRVRALVLGRSTMTNGAFALILHEPIKAKSKPTQPEREFSMVYIDEATDFVYSDFLDFLNRTETDYRELVDEE